MKRKIQKCDMCGEKLTKRESEIYNEISEENIPCFCSITKRIRNLEENAKMKRVGGEKMTKSGIG